MVSYYNKSVKLKLNMAFHGLKQLLPQSVQRMGASQQVDAVNILKEAHKIIYGRLGEDISAQVKPLYVKNKMLIIQCDSSLVAQELKYREQEIVFLINKRTGKQSVDKLRYLS
jgi:predicted nucleic acid-binding Zn ribbon protein